jgi:hypothetical protein
MSAAEVTDLAGESLWWGGQVIGLVAAGIFVVFSGWIVVQRLRTRDGATTREDDDG